MTHQQLSCLWRWGGGGEAEPAAHMVGEFTQLYSASGGGGGV